MIADRTHISIIRIHTSAERNAIQHAPRRLHHIWLADGCCTAVRAAYMDCIANHGLSNKVVVILWPGSKQQAIRNDEWREREMHSKAICFVDMSRLRRRI